MVLYYHFRVIVTVVNCLHQCSGSSLELFGVSIRRSSIIRVDYLGSGGWEWAKIRLLYLCICFLVLLLEFLYS